MFNLSNRTYDILKWIVMIVFPAIATFYAALAGPLGLPMAAEVVATLGALTVFLGSYLQMSMATYARKTLSTTENDSSYPFAMTGDLYDALKWLVKVGLPGFSVMYISLAQTWDLPYLDIIPVVATAIALLLGTILQISSTQRAASFAQ